MMTPPVSALQLLLLLLLVVLTLHARSIAATSIAATSVAVDAGGDMAAADLFLLVRALVIRVRGAAEPGLRAALQRRGRLLQLRLLLQAVLICAAPQSASVQSAPRGQRRVASAG